MIKPGTVCMIRGMPKNSPAYAAEGRIVTTVRYIGEYNGVSEVHEFTPAVVIEGTEFTKCREKWLHPFDDFEDDLTREALDEAIERTFRETLVKALEKI